MDDGLRVYERYTGIRGQRRVGLVDKHGRVHHYDEEDLMEATLPPEDRDDVPEENLPQKPPIEPPDDDYDGEEEEVPEEHFFSDEDAEEDPTVDNRENDSA